MATAQRRFKPARMLIGRRQLAAAAITLLAAIIWVLVALVVALPKQLINLRLQEAATLFFHDFHFIFFTLLIVVDIVIDVVLFRNERMLSTIRNKSKQLFLVSFAGLLIFVVQEFSDLEYVRTISAYTFVALAILVRYWSYLDSNEHSPVAVPVEKILRDISELAKGTER